MFLIYSRCQFNLEILTKTFELHQLLGFFLIPEDLNLIWPLK